MAKYRLTLSRSSISRPCKPSISHAIYYTNRRCIVGGTDSVNCKCIAGHHDHRLCGQMNYGDSHSSRLTFAGEFCGRVWPKSSAEEFCRKVSEELAPEPANSSNATKRSREIKLNKKIASTFNKKNSFSLPLCLRKAGVATSSLLP